MRVNKYIRTNIVQSYEKSSVLRSEEQTFEICGLKLKERKTTLKDQKYPLIFVLKIRVGMSKSLYYVTEKVFLFDSLMLFYMVLVYGFLKASRSSVVSLPANHIPCQNFSMIKHCVERQ